MDAFDIALKQDKMRSNILKISELGLVQMTRKRTRASLPQLLTESCPTCDGRGRNVSITTSPTRRCAAFGRFARAAPEATRILVRASAAVAAFLYDEEGVAMDRLERETACRVTVETIEGSDAGAPRRPRDMYGSDARLDLPLNLLIRALTLMSRVLDRGRAGTPSVPGFSRRARASGRPGRRRVVADAHALISCRDDELPALLAAAGESARRRKGRHVTYSRKVFLPITNLCRDRCSYCTFRKDPDYPGAWTMQRDEIASGWSRAPETRAAKRH